MVQRVLSSDPRLAAVLDPTGDGSYLGSTLRLLWPGADLAPAPRLRRGGGRTYVMVPSADRPKLLLPARPRRVAAGALRNFKTAASPREQAATTLVALAAQLGMADLLPHAVRIAPASDDIVAHLSAALGQPLWPCLYVGPPRAVRKPVLQLLDARGRTFGFAKVGVDAFTRALVRAERDSVRFLSGRRWTALAVPEVLHAGTWSGHEVLVQSAFRRGAPPPSDSVPLGRAMHELARARGEHTARLLGSSYWQRLTDRLHALEPGEHVPVLQRLHEAIGRHSGDAVIAFGSSHGDWAPWNMTAAGERILAWDWEKFESDVPIGFDAVHFDVQGRVVLAAVPADHAFADALHRAPALLRPIGVPAAVARVVVLLYALDIAVRYLEDGELSAGTTRMSRLGTWLESVARAAEESAAATG